MFASKFFTLASLVFASPAVLALVLPRVPPVALSRFQVDSISPLTQLASSAYCPPTQTADWSCGPCLAGNPDVEPTASGGDGGEVQFWYVGFSPSMDSVVVGHQGTDFGEIEAIVTDANIFRDTLDPTLFPGISSSVKAHGGFLDAHARAAFDVLNAVASTIDRTGTNQITIASHSLGAALGILDAVMFRAQFGADIGIRFVGFGMPRVGNQAFADFVDANISDVTRVINQQDPVPLLPGRFLGFHHPSGEVHIGEDGSFIACSGQESAEDGCMLDETRTVFSAEADDHTGPYNGFNIGSGSC